MNPQEQCLKSQLNLLEAHNVNATSNFVDISWLGKTHFFETGTGYPIIFVIGGGGFSSAWAPLMSRIENFRLIAVDRPGFGLTNYIKHTKENFRTIAVNFLRNFLDKLEIENAVFISNSMGSLWTLWLALEHPERVKSMVHIGCPALLLDTGAPMPMRLLGVPLLGNLMMTVKPPSKDQAKMVFSMMNEGTPVEKDSALLEAIIATEEIPYYGSAWRSLLGSVLTLLGAREEFSFTEEDLKKINQPNQLIWGEEDPFGSVQVGQRAASILPKAEFSVIPGGHMPWLDSPDKVAEIVDQFLKKEISYKEKQYS